MHITAKRTETVRPMKFGENVVRPMVLKGPFSTSINPWEGDIGLFFLSLHSSTRNLLSEHGAC